MAKRRDSRERIEAQIIELGRRHLVEHGAAGLSLRAIARDLGMVSSAVYRYVSSRDELLTLLLVDAYSELADAVDRARDAMSEVWSDDVIAIAQAARHWAIAHPASWALLYGSPVPGYHAPADRTVGVGTRVVGALFDAVAAGIATGDIRLTNQPAPQPISSDFERTPAGVRISRRRFRHRQMLRDLGGRGGRDQPRGVRAVRRRHAERPADGVRHPDAAAGRRAEPVRCRRAAIRGRDDELERVQRELRRRKRLAVAT